MPWYEVASTLLYYVTLPVVKISLLLINIVLWLLSPLIYLADVVFQLCLIPYNIAAKFETVFYFLFVAFLTGTVAALVCYGLVRTVVVVFKLDTPRAANPKDTPATGHDVRSYRKARQKKKLKAEQEQAEIERRARLLAESPLLKEAMRDMSRRHLEEEAESAGGRLRRGERRSLVEETIVENSSGELSE